MGRESPFFLKYIYILQDPSMLQKFSKINLKYQLINYPVQEDRASAKHKELTKTIAKIKIFIYCIVG